MSKFNVVFVLGPPGAGKGTQCQKIVEKFGYVHLSAGELLREERIKPGSKFREIIETHIQNKAFIPVEVTLSIIKTAMKNSSKNDFLIDGFPVNENNLQGWSKEMGDKVNLKFVIFFNCSSEDCTKRVIGRAAGGSGRSYDNEDSLKKRFETYMDSTMPIIEYYDKLNLVRHIDASGSTSEVFCEVKGLFA